jgi:hypothetical protein
MEERGLRQDLLLVYGNGILIERGLTILSASRRRLPMLFKKLFRLLVVSGTMMGAASGCAANAADAKAAAKKSDAGTSPDAGSKAPDPGGGAQGW